MSIDARTANESRSGCLTASVPAAPLRRVLSADERNISNILECGHTITVLPGLGCYAAKPAKRRRCYKCGEMHNEVNHV